MFVINKPRYSSLFLNYTGKHPWDPAIMESDMFVNSAIIKQIKKEFTITYKSVKDRQEYYCQQCGYEASWKTELK